MSVQSVSDGAKRLELASLLHRKNRVGSENVFLTIENVFLAQQSVLLTRKGLLLTMFAT